jgi:hypothetical protein
LTPTGTPSDTSTGTPDVGPKIVIGLVVTAVIIAIIGASIYIIRKFGFTRPSKRFTHRIDKKASDMTLDMNDAMAPKVLKPAIVSVGGYYGTQGYSAAGVSDQAFSDSQAFSAAGTQRYNTDGRYYAFSGEGFPQNYEYQAYDDANNFFADPNGYIDGAGAYAGPEGYTEGSAFQNPAYCEESAYVEEAGAFAEGYEAYDPNPNVFADTNAYFPTQYEQPTYAPEMQRGYSETSAPNPVSQFAYVNRSKSAAHRLTMMSDSTIDTEIRTLNRAAFVNGTVAGNEKSMGRDRQSKIYAGVLDEYTRASCDEARDGKVSSEPLLRGDEW